jgi:hypothetical protein
VRARQLGPVLEHDLSPSSRSTRPFAIFHDSRLDAHLEHAHRRLRRRAHVAHYRNGGVCRRLAALGVGRTAFGVPYADGCPRCTSSA